MTKPTNSSVTMMSRFEFDIVLFQRKRPTRTYTESIDASSSQLAFKILTTRFRPMKEVTVTLIVTVTLHHERIQRG
jgi:hypothetical protein